MKRGSRLNLAYCLFQAHDAPLEAIYKDAKGQTVFSHAFTIADYCDPSHVEAACGDSNQARGAMTKAVCKRMADIDEPSGAHKAALNAGAKVTFALLQECRDADGEIDRAQVSMSKGGNVRVPSRLMLKVPDDKASESEVEKYERESGLPFTLDGTKGRSFNELSQRITVKAKRPEGNGAGQGAVAVVFSRLDAAKLLLSGAAGVEQWAPYMAALAGAEIAAAIAVYADNMGEGDASA